MTTSTNRSLTQGKGPAEMTRTSFKWMAALIVLCAPLLLLAQTPRSASSPISIKAPLMRKLPPKPPKNPKPIPPVSEPVKLPASEPSKEDVDDFAKLLEELQSQPASTSAPSSQDVDDFAALLGDSASAPNSEPTSIASLSVNPDNALEDKGGALVEPGGAFADALDEAKSSFFSWKSYEIWRDPITVNAFAALICGFLGVYVILRRMVFVSATLSQFSSVGVVLGFFFSVMVGIPRSEQGEGDDASYGLLGFVTDPLWLAIVFSLAGAAMFALNSDRKRMSQESLIGIGYSVAAALVMAILNSKTMTAESHAVESILFGDAAVVEPRERWIVGFVSVSVLVAHLYFFRAFLFSSLDPITAKTLGIDPKLFSVLLLMSLGLVISVTTRAIGPLPVFGYLVLPPAAAILLSDQHKVIFLMGPIFGLFSAIFGYYLSWILEIPTKASVVIVASLTLLPGITKRGIERLRKPGQ
jgi:zinc transport system permease protein